MDRPLLWAWIEALRSGNYREGQTVALHEHELFGLLPRYNALGVLCAVFAKMYPDKIKVHRSGRFTSYDNFTTIIPLCVQKVIMVELEEITWLSSDWMTLRLSSADTFDEVAEKLTQRFNRLEGSYRGETGNPVG